MCNSVNKQKNIVTVVENGNCLFCGTCAGVCPQGAIKMLIEKGIYVPKVDSELCNGCGTCVKACPALPVDYKELHSDWELSELLRGSRHLT